jgi:hypothetical protein
VAEIRLTPSRMRFPDWGERNEPSITIVLRMVTTSPFHVEDMILADIGLHALSRRIERARPNDDAAVFTDLKALADAWRATVAKGGDFAIPTKSGGKWIGSTTIVNGGAMMVVRTFVDG